MKTSKDKTTTTILGEIRIFIHETDRGKKKILRMTAKLKPLYAVPKMKVRISSQSISKRTEKVRKLSS